MDNRPIGVFDSGLGGLTVLGAIMEMMPNENTVYFGDSGRAPYGTKSKETVIKYTFQDIKFLLSNDVKMVVIGCNTASACSLDIVKNSFDIPIVEVIQPGAAAAARSTQNKKIGIIGTHATVSSGVYERAITSNIEGASIYSKACPLFVSLAEEGWWDNDIADRIVKEYLTSLKDEGIDTLILGCTHYPLLQDCIQRFMGDQVKLINSAVEVAKVAENTLKASNSLNPGVEPPIHSFFTSDSVEKFQQLGSAFLDKEIKSAQRAKIEEY